MVFDGNNSDYVSSTQEFDIVIVGAGTIGLYMAARLLKDSPKRKICIVESGNATPNIESNIENSISIGQRHNGTLNGRYSGLGGGSSNWGGQLAEFEQADFERPDSRWPINYKEMKSYYEDVYSFMGLKNSLSSEYFDNIFSSEVNNEIKIENYYTVRLKGKDSLFTNYFKKEINSDSLKIIINTTANKINFNNTAAKELVCKTSSGRNLCIKADKFIFASGTLGINQFFLSTQAINEVPWKSNNHIGKYFQDHLGGVVGRLKINDEAKFRKSFEKRIVDGIKIERKLKFRSKYRIGKRNGAVVFFKYQSKDQEYIKRFRLFIRELGKNSNLNDVIVFLNDIYRVRSYLLLFITKLIFKRQIHEVFDSNGILVFVQSEQVPIAKSQITILKDKSLKNGLFKICVNWNWLGKEIDAIQDLTMELNQLLMQQNIAEIKMDPRLGERRNPDFLQNFHDTNHQCGGMKMSRSDKDGVVDSNCKVWGTDNVWVAGAAVFPSSGHANSTLTALALTERIVQNSF